jgi:hypothetical protein
MDQDTLSRSVNAHVNTQCLARSSQYPYIVETKLCRIEDGCESPHQHYYSEEIGDTAYQDDYSKVLFGAHRVTFVIVR